MYRTSFECIVLYYNMIALLRAVDRFALSIDCSARTIYLSFAHHPIDRATTDGSRNNRSIVQQVACNRTHLNSNALAQSIDSARVRIGAKAW
jgi:hypothetical protein